MNQSLHKLLMTVLLVCSISIIAQEKEVEFSKSFEIQVGEGIKKSERKDRYTFKHDGKVIILIKDKKKLILQKFDAKTLRNEENIEKKKFFNKTIDNIDQIGDNIVIFYEVWDRKNKIESLEAQKISLKTLEIGDSKKIIEQQGKIRGEMDLVKNKVVNKYDYKISEDKSKLLIYYTIKNKKKKSKDNRKKINVFDKELKTLWKQDIEMPFSYGDMEEKGFMIDENNNFYAIVLVRNKGEHKDKFLAFYKLMMVKKGNNEIKIYDIDVENEFLVKLNFYEDDDSRIYALGTLLKKDKMLKEESSGITGIAIIEINEKGIEKIMSYQLSSEIFSKNVSWIDNKKKKKYIKDNIPGFLFLRLRKIILNNENIIILGEEYYSFSSHVNASQHYKYKDVFAMKINENNGVSWMKRLPKNQSGANKKEGGMSFSYLSYRDKHYLLFLDNVKNMNLEEEQVPYVHYNDAGGYLTAYIIDDKTGDVEKESIFNTRKFKGTQIEKIRTDDIVRLSDSEMVIEGYDGEGKDFLVKVSVKK